MQEFTTGWFDSDTTTPRMQAKCDARVYRELTSVVVEWTVSLKMISSEGQIPINKYIDVMAQEVPTTSEQDSQRIKRESDIWTGTTEHTVGGRIVFQDENASTQTSAMVFNATSNLDSPQIFSNKNLPISYEVYDPNTPTETSMPFASVFTTENYLETHKALVPRNNLYNNRCKYVLRHTKQQNVNRKF